VADGTTTTYLVAQRLGFDQATIEFGDVLVYFNDVLQTSLDQAPEYSVTAQTSGTTVNFFNPPVASTRIYIAVTTNAQAVINAYTNLITFKNISFSTGQLITVTTFNDTREQRLETQVFVGPVSVGEQVSEGFDDTEFDQGSVTGEPLSYSYSEGITVTANDIDLGRIITNIDRLRVVLNGHILTPLVDFTISGTMLNLPNVLGSTDVLMVSSMTDTVVPEAMEFRIFQDMRGVQATYRMTPSTTTFLTEQVTALADVIYVDDASTLSQPDFAANIWGVVTIDGERIMYRDINTSNNTISSLLRGTAGTAAASHASGAIVYDMGRGNLLPQAYQNYVESNSFLADGMTTTFLAENVFVAQSGAIPYDYQPYDTVDFPPDGYDYGAGNPSNFVEVYVGGSLQSGNYTFNSYRPVSITFNTAPAAGLEVTILAKFAVNWYQKGEFTASDGVPLQETNTGPARFLRGLS